MDFPLPEQGDLVDSPNAYTCVIEDLYGPCLEETSRLMGVPKKRLDLVSGKVVVTVETTTFRYISL